MYIYKTAVIGAGAMGAEIAQVISFSGIPVLLKDVDQARVDRGLDTIRKIYQRRVDRGKMTQDEMEKKVLLVAGVTSYDAMKDVDLAIEAVPEQLPLKQQIFRDLDGVLPESSVIASNTSSLSISALGGATKRPHKVVGMHFFYPAHIMKLVEVIPGLETSEDVVGDILSFAEGLRKLPVRVNECPGFLVNRILMPYLNEAAFCVQEGTATTRQIDEAMVAFGFPMGPFTLVDNLGFDVCREVVNVLLDAYGPRMEPAPIWERLYGLKRLGAKAGAGFYLYGERAGQPDPELEKILAELRSKPQGASEFSVHRLVLPMINEAIRCLEERVCTASDVDLSVIAGLGFPQAKGGILHYADDVGLEVVLSELNGLTKRYGERFWPSPLLKRMVAAGRLGKKAKKGFFEYTE
ncbi:MAG: 3-hydroxyacyl-CoA dehydrogenase [Candidatus Omnitrophica bacterium]|nr:3-hydroxyacyl-CoA dehydrogenase [Candidatus Omnitrophota bacterium]